MKIIPYSVVRKATWDKFVAQAKNGHFLFYRDYMDYQSEQYTDCSLMVYDDAIGEESMEKDYGVDNLKAVFPANWQSDEACVYSHQGLVFGGLLVETEISQTEVLEVMQAVLMYYSAMYQARRVVVTPLPYVYCSYPSGEQLYALTCAGAQLESRSVSTIVSMRHQLRIRSLRLRQAKKAIDNDLFIDRRKENDWASLHDFWQILLEQNDITIHSEQEMRHLIELFPKNIKLFLVRKVDGDNAPIVGGCVVYINNKVVHIKYLAANEEGRANGALDLLSRYLIQQCYTDVDYIDFGSNTDLYGMHLDEGLISLKEGFGGRAVCYDTYAIELDRSVLQRMTGHNALNTTNERIRFLTLKEVNESFEPHISRAISQVVRSGRYVNGEALKRFETHFAAYIGTRHCVGCGNGIEALTLLLRSLKQAYHWHDGDEVIVPANCFIATILAISDAGLVPVLCEPSLSDYLIDVDKMKAAYTPRTRAVVAVHLYGKACPMQTITEWAREQGVKVVEDVSQAIGAQCGGERLGHLSDAATFSFYPEMNLGALGDGGCVVTDDKALADMVRRMSNYGCSGEYRYDMRGMNSRLDDIQAAALDVKLQRLDQDNDRRRQLASVYLSGIKNPLVTLPRVSADMSEHVFNNFVVRCPVREQLRDYLKNKGIETMVHYPIPPHKQKAYAELNHLRLPVSERIHQEVVSLPLTPVMTEAQIERIVRAINDFVADIEIGG